MAKKVDIGNIELELSQIVSDYTAEVTNAIEEEIENTAKLVLDDIKASTAWTDRTGDYRKGFAIKKDNKQGETVRTIYNRRKPALTHLLEMGHGLKGGGRVSARPHLRPAYDKHVPDMEKRIEKIIKDGG